MATPENERYDILASWMKTLWRQHTGRDLPVANFRNHADLSAIGQGQITLTQWVEQKVKPVAATLKPAPKPAPRPAPATPAPEPAPRPAPKPAPKPKPTRPPLTTNPGRTDLWRDVLEVNPWLTTIGVTPAQLKQIAATSSGTAEVLQRVRELDAVAKRTQAMYRGDGSRRFSTEAELFAWEDQVRTALRQAGQDVDRFYSTPQSLVGFAESDLKPDEVRTRLQVWNGIIQSGPKAREIFYVYAGLTPSDDELFEAVVDPGRAQELYRNVNHQTAQNLAGPNAFGQWINRARQAGNSRVVRILTNAQRLGHTTAAAVQRVINVDPEFANKIMDVLYTGGDPDAGDFLDLTALLDSYEMMAVGAAAQDAGLTLPSLSRLKEIRARGIERSQMISGYQAFGMDRQKLNAAVLRARGVGFGQEEFEEASFFGDIDAQRLAESGEAYMASAGRSQGSFRFDVGARGQFTQSGLSAR